MISVRITGDRELMLKLDKMPVAVQSGLARVIKILSLRLQAHIQQNKLSGQVLKVQTGALRRSIHALPVVRTGDTVRGGVASSGDVKYAAIHEFGGRTKAHVILPRKAQALAFLGAGGETVFARRVNHPGSVMPERSFLRSGLGDMTAEITLEMKRAVIIGMIQTKQGAARGGRA